MLLKVSLMKFILRISNEIKWKVKVDLLEGSLKLFFWDIQGDQIEGETGVSRSIIDELHSRDIQGDQMEGESGVTANIIDELHYWDIQCDQMEGESGVTGSIIDEIYSSDIQRDQM